MTWSTDNSPPPMGRPCWTHAGGEDEHPCASFRHHPDPGGFDMHDENGTQWAWADSADSVRWHPWQPEPPAPPKPAPEVGVVYDCAPWCAGVWEALAAGGGRGIWRIADADEGAEMHDPGDRWQYLCPLPVWREVTP